MSKTTPTPPTASELCERLVAAGFEQHTGENEYTFVRAADGAVRWVTTNPETGEPAIAQNGPVLIPATGSGVETIGHGVVFSSTGTGREAGAYRSVNGWTKWVPA